MLIIIRDILYVASATSVIVVLNIIRMRTPTSDISVQPETLSLVPVLVLKYIYMSCRAYTT